MSDLWPPLPYPAWKDTYETLHRWMQIAGKVRLARTPLVNHWWNVTFRPTPAGLTSREMPDESGAFAIDFDFLRHRLVISTSRGDSREIDGNGMRRSGSARIHSTSSIERGQSSRRSRDIARSASRRPPVWHRAQ